MTALNHKIPVVSRGDEPSNGNQKTDEIARFVAHVGERVRAVRRQSSMSRRVLSERSGVSQRYLAQLELGEGNISIALLLKVANALEHKIEWLVNTSTLDSDEAANINELFSNASVENKEQVLAILDPEYARARRKKRIALIGLRGAGKSTLGSLAGAHLNVPFMELNDDIARSNGMSVNETIELYGQEGFRLLERQAIERIASEHETLILAVAGGIVSERETFTYLMSNYHTIWLKASPEEHMQRVRAQGDERPMAGNPAAMDELRAILKKRETLYEKADIVVNTSRTALDQSLLDILDKIRTIGFLD